MIIQKHNTFLKNQIFTILISGITLFSLSVSCSGLTVITENNEPFSPANSDLLTYKDTLGRNSPVENLADWEQKRWQMQQRLQEVMGELPDMSDLPPLDLQVRDTLRRGSHDRLTVSFRAAEGERVPALLYLPHRRGIDGRLPAMVVLHGTGQAGKYLVDGTSSRANRAQARELAERGYVVIAPDYPGMGELADHDFHRDRYESGTMMGIFNHMRSIDLLLERGDVDPDRIGVIGHSLGGHNAMFLAAFDPRLKAVVSSCGWTLMGYYRVETGLGPWAQDVYMPSIRDRYDLDPERLPFDFDEIIALIAPRAFFSNSPIHDSNFEVRGVEKGIELALEAYLFLNAEENLQVRYPDAGHDFPTETRLEAYRFIDEKLNHTPTNHVIE